MFLSFCCFLHVVFLAFVAGAVAVAVAVSFSIRLSFAGWLAKHLSSFGSFGAVWLVKRARLP
jgi:hypothetical protein